MARGGIGSSRTTSEAYSSNELTAVQAYRLLILAGEVRSSDIFVWNHENDSRNWVAPDVRQFIEWWAGDGMED